MEPKIIAIHVVGNTREPSQSEGRARCYGNAKHLLRSANKEVRHCKHLNDPSSHFNLLIISILRSNTTAAEKEARSVKRTLDNKNVM